MTVTYARTVDSPLGVLTLAGDGTTITHLRFREQTHPPRGQDQWVRVDDAYDEAARQLRAYFDGTRTAFTVPLRLVGTPFQRRVWEALREIPYGATCSYGAIAARVGVPGAARAVGLANGRNPVAIIVPCHRVVGADGSLTGYGGGLARKESLLALEREPRPAPTPA